jgi:hypothetical protein
MSRETSETAVARHRRHSESEPPDGLVVLGRVQGEVPHGLAVDTDDPDVKTLDEDPHMKTRELTAAGDPGHGRDLARIR